MKKIISGFTLVELLIVIAIIGLLATVGIMSFDSIQANVRNTQRSSDLKIIGEALEKYYAKNGEYPNCVGTLDSSPSTVVSTLTGLDPNVLTTPTAASGTNSITCNDLNSSSSDVFGYVVNGSHWTLKYREEGTGNIIATSSSRYLVTCPTGFIVVPGSSTYGTSSFCVMKYEAKADNGSGTGDTSQTTGYNTWPASSYPISSTRQLVSTAAGYPVANITQTNAIATSSSFVKGCSTGCHLITEAEWMTIAQNVLNVASNWSGGTVGSGYIPRGNSDSSAALDATSDLTGINKRTLTLSNGEVIWDFAGNIYEWTSGQVSGGQPGVASNDYSAWIDWNNVTTAGTLSINPRPIGTGITGAGNWDYSYGIGRLISSTTDSSTKAIIRSGAWGHNNCAGVLMMEMDYAPSFLSNDAGLRVTR